MCTANESPTAVTGSPVAPCSMPEESIATWPCGSQSTANTCSGRGCDVSADLDACVHGGDCGSARRGAGSPRSRPRSLAPWSSSSSWSCSPSRRSSCGRSVKANKRKALERKQAELEPVRKLAFEDVTALGEELQLLDIDLAGHELDAGRERRLPAGAGRLRVGEDGRGHDHRARARQARHRDPRGRPLRDGLRPRPGRRRAAARPAARRASSTRATASPSRTSPTRPPGGARRDVPGLRARRRAGPAPAPSPTSAR